MSLLCSAGTQRQGEPGKRVRREEVINKCFLGEENAVWPSEKSKSTAQPEVLGQSQDVEPERSKELEIRT